MPKITSLSKSQIKTLLKPFSFDLSLPLKIKALDGGTVNSLYQVQVGKDAFILKIDEKSDLKKLKSEFNLLEFLSSKTGLSDYVPKLIKTKSGQSHVYFNQKPVYLQKIINGKPWPTASLGRIQARKMGQILASLHALKPPRHFKPHYFHISKLKKILKEIKPKLVLIDAKLYHELQALLSHWPRLKTQKHIIHADLFKDNIHFNKAKLIGFFDFEFAGLGHPFYDLALFFMSHLWTKTGPSLKSTQTFFKAYFALGPIHPLKREEIRLAFIHAALTIVITRLKTFECGIFKGPAHQRRDYKDFLHKLHWAQSKAFDKWAAKVIL